MKPRDWFTVGARLLGIWVWLEAITSIRTLLDIRLGYFHPISTPSEIYFVSVIQHALVGSYLLFFGHHLAGLIYRESAPAPDDPAAAETDRT